MFRVVRKKKPKHVYTNQSEIKSEKLISVNLDRQGIYRVAIEHRAKAAF